MKSCACPKCVSACRSAPGIPTPKEVARAIMLGMAKRYSLIRDDQGTPMMVRPSRKGAEGKEDEAAHFIWEDPEPCTFLTAENRCALHASGIKPLHCRQYHHDDEDAVVDKRVQHGLRIWRGRVGEYVMAMWNAAASMKRIDT